MARNNLAKHRARKRSAVSPRFDMDLHFKKGYEAKVAKSLHSNAATRTVLELFQPGQERQTLVLLLCNTVYCRRQADIKTDAAMEAIGGDTPDNIENAPQRIKTFCNWLAKQIEANFDLRNDNTVSDLIPRLLRIAETFPLTTQTARNFVQDRNWLYVEALNSLAGFMKGKSRRPYADMARLLEVSAHALGKKQTYDAHTILVRLKAPPPVNSWVNFSSHF